MKLEISENSLIEAKSQVEYLRVIRKSIQNKISKTQKVQVNEIVPFRVKEELKNQLDQIQQIKDEVINT